jgi:hypothetical protein
MMSLLSEAMTQVEQLITTVSAGMPESALPKMRTDPDDPWASTINVPNAVYKVRTAHCGTACMQCAIGRDSSALATGSRPPPTRLGGSHSAAPPGAERP